MFTIPYTRTIMQNMLWHNVATIREVPAWLCPSMVKMSVY